MKCCQQPCAADINGNSKVLFIEELNKKLHDRKTFNCGLADVNEFLKKRASQQARQSVNRTWVALDDETAASQILIVTDFIIMQCKLCYLNRHQSYQLYFSSRQF